MADAVNVKKLKVAELKKELQQHGLTVKGNKSDLQARLTEFLQGQGVALHEGEDVEGDDDLDNDDHDEDDVLADDSVDDLVAEESLSEEKKESSSLSADEVKSGKTEKIENPLPANGKEKKSSITAAKLTVNSAASENERKLQRMKRFGGPVSENDRKLARAERFGINLKETGKQDVNTTSTTQATPIDVNKLKKRAERFGVVSPAVSNIVEKEKLLKRKERFGVTTVAAATADPLEIKKKKRAERFSNS
ncbi:uncharacterized protein C31H12.03c isoform X1 [Nematostella vectensis]|uniref:uncharacterized protein C31H12.03c isoform X1 n=1 Tax=Nematostella vectensis TaxID=45351 RepID=UPI00139055E4|nr:uncharacterized protein C31H12.03c isoform X1 [Nematostella vectensis]